MINHKVLITQDAIQTKVKELAEQINQFFSDEEELVVVCVLKGSVMFFADLVKNIKIPVTYEFIRVSSYGNEQKSSGTLQNVLLNTCDLNGKNVLVVEDIVDTGNTLYFINEFLKKEYNMKNYKTVSLINKPSKREKEIDADFYGFEIDDKFIYGYGLDKKEFWRNLNYIAFVD